MKKLATLCMALAVLSGVAVPASAADYSFKTDPEPEYYDSTNYEDRYDADYNYGEHNQIDYDIPEIKYGLSQEFLEQSLNNPYLPSGLQYGQHWNTTSGGGYPESDFSDVSHGSNIEITYRPELTIADLTRPDGSIGTVSISRVGLKVKVYEGATDSSMSKGAGHYEGSGLYFGNVALFGHNRGNLKVGDTVKYETNQGTKTYEVTFVGKISSTDYSYTNEMGDNRITLITCVANQPSLRLCVQAVEIH